MQLVVATFMIIVFVLSGYGLSTANPKGHDTAVGKEVERDKVEMRPHFPSTYPALRLHRSSATAR